jgi:hypothetical protein
MKVYFLSETPCALFIDDEYLGVSNSFPKYADISLKDGLFIRFMPENALPICFFLTENIRFAPPDKVDVYLLKNAIVLYAKNFTFGDFTLTPIAQARYENTLVSVFKQGEVQLSIQSPNGFFVATLPPTFDSCSIQKAENFFLITSENQLLVFSENGERLLLENCQSYRLENSSLYIRAPLDDCYTRIAEKEYLFTETGCVLQKITLSEKTGSAPLGYAFFESVLKGVNYDEILADELLEEKEKIARFLGDFVAVWFTEDINCYALIRKKSERLYEADYFSVQIQNDKITEITG